MHIDEGWFEESWFQWDLELISYSDFGHLVQRSIDVCELQVCRPEEEEEEQ